MVLKGEKGFINASGTILLEILAQARNKPLRKIVSSASTKGSILQERHQLITNAILNAQYIYRYEHNIPSSDPVLVEVVDYAVNYDMGNKVSQKNIKEHIILINKKNGEIIQLEKKIEFSDAWLEKQPRDKRYKTLKKEGTEKFFKE